MEDILKDLNEEQKWAVLHTNGPLLVIAGAGSGKTKVITHRVAHLTLKGVAPHNILAVTFTNKAAEEMRERILKLLNFQPLNFKFRNPASEIQHPFISTFHSLGVRILREDGGSIGIPKKFSIIDEDDALKIIKRILKDLNLKTESFNPSRIKSFISGEKNKLKNYEDYLETSEDYFPKIMSEIWYRYEEELKKQELLDFDDLITKTISLFKSEPDILKKYQDKWQFVHIDEYQDTNHSQYILSRMLALPRKNICVVGDSDQAIYSFRGADFTNILNFEKDWEGASVITLNKNYRSTRSILSAANASIVNNKIRYPKNLESVNDAGDIPLFFEAENELEEGMFVAQTAKEILKNDSRAKIAVLLRANFQSRVFEEFFLRHELPYQMIGVKFFERKEIKDTLAYLKYSLNRNDFLSFQRILSSPPRGIGEKTALKFFKKEKGIPEAKNLELKKISDFIERLAGLIASEKPSEIIRIILEDSGYGKYLLNLCEEGEHRVQNIMELASLAKKYDGLEAPEGINKLLEESALMSHEDYLKHNENSIKIITAHAAKGLEFDSVFVVGLEEGLFPFQSFHDVNKEMKIEEERRLFYVALTRARKNLFLSMAKIRSVFGDKKINRPSRFLMEIKDKIIKI